MEEEQKGNKIFHTYLENEKVYLKKGTWLGWHIVHPIKNEDGSRNWKNLICGGSWLRLALIIGFVIISLGAIFEAKSLVDLASECVKNKDTIINPLINNTNFTLGNNLIPIMGVIK